MTYYPKADVGLDHYTCVCGEHCFAYPFDDALETWRKYRVTHPLIRKMLKEKGRAVDTPPPPHKHHVILLSPEDAHLFKLKRWRVFKSPARKKAKFTVQRAVMSKALQRLVLPDAKIVQFVSGDGCDCRRSNLKATTMKSVALERRSKRLVSTPSHQGNL